MKNEVILTGKTVEEAMADARARYGTPENELSFEILEMPKKGFLGFGAAPAKIKVTITKALEEVNLSDLVSELRSMKVSTDRDGEDEKTAQKPRENRPERQKKNPQTASPRTSSAPQSEPKKAQEAKETKSQQPAKPQQPKSAQPKANAPQANANPQPKKQQPKAAAKPGDKIDTLKPQAEAASKAEAAPKTEAASKAEAASKEAAPKTETAPRTEAPKKQTAKAEIPPKTEPADDDESSLPAALRRPVQKNNAPKQPPKKQQKPRDNRDGETKKKDLLSAVMGIADAKPASESPAVTVTPAVMKPAPAQQPAPAVAETTVSVDSGENSSISAAVDAALAAIEAETPAPLEFEEEEEPAAPAKEEVRLEFVTPAEMELALNFLNTLLSDMGLEAKAVAGEAREGEEAPEGMIAARVEILGDDTGILIGHHGETLDAIQYLMNLSTSRRSGAGKREFVKILLDIGNYREKREDTLRALARRTAARVVKYKRSIVLEPMNPYERRIIHSEIHNIPDVSTHSVGSDENRKIVITYEGADKPKDSGKGRRDRGRRRGDRSDRPEKGERAERAEHTDKFERPDRAEKNRRERPAKPVRAKSIDEVQIDLSADSTKTFGSIGVDEGVETDDPIEAIARETEAGEESLREY